MTESLAGRILTSAKQLFGAVSPKKKWSIAAAFALGLSTVGCGAAAEDPNDTAPAEETPAEAVGSTRQEVQVAYGSSFHLDDSSLARLATGVLFKRLTPKSWASCGVTFISKHFAITAAHCIRTLTVDNNDTVDTGDQTFLVFAQDIAELGSRLAQGDAALANRFIQSWQVSGTFPNYTHQLWLTADDGYRFREANTQCRVRVRCAFGQENCPAAMKSVDGGRGVDIALIHCADRTTNTWATVATSDAAVNSPVEVHWFHELLNMKVTPQSPGGPADSFNKYTVNNPGSEDENYHYRGLPQNQFFPLVSKQRPNGVLYVTGSARNGSEVWSDAYGCHGTSGSGVFPGGGALPVLLGPVIAPNGSVFVNNTRLCADPSLITPGTATLSYVRPTFTRQLEALVLGDR